MIVLVSLIVLLRGYPCFHDFFAWCIPTSIFIQLNDFSTCSNTVLLTGNLPFFGCPCFHDFSHGASHPYIPIQNDFALILKPGKVN